MGFDSVLIHSSGFLSRVCAGWCLGKWMTGFAPAEGSSFQGLSSYQWTTNELSMHVSVCEVFTPGSDCGPWHGRALNLSNSISCFFSPCYFKQWMLCPWGIISCSQEIFCKKGASKDSCSCVDLCLLSFIFLSFTWFMCIRIIDQMLEPIFIKYLEVLQTIHYVPSSKLILQEKFLQW